MSATITWRVGTMECYPTYQQEKDVVFTVHWDCLGSQTVNNKTYNGRVYGSCGVTYLSGSEFTPYELLTEPQVLNWVWEAIGSGSKENYESSVQSQIDNQINPPVLILPLPWTPPYISGQPSSVAAVTGSTVTFTVMAGGPSELTYQWKKNGNDVSGETSYSYTINNIQTTDEGDYTVVVSATNGISITSNPATLTIINPPPPPPPPPTPSLPTITEQPVSQTIIIGDGAVFNVNATGQGPIVYQWFKDDVEIQGATGNTHIIQTSALTDAGVYTATVTNIVGTVTRSNPATLTVNEPTPS